MSLLLNIAAISLAHAGEVLHVHPHEAGVALALGLVLAFTVGSVRAMLSRKPTGS